MKASPMFNCLPGTMLSWRRMHEWSLGRSCGRALLNDTADLAASHRLFNPVQRWPRFLVLTGRGPGVDLISALEFEQVFEKLYQTSQRALFDINSSEAQHYRRYLLQRRTEARRMGEQPAQTYNRMPQCSPSPAEVEIPDGIGRAPRGINDGKGLVFISHLGEVYPSGFLPLSGGNVRRQSLADIYRNSPLFRKLRDSKNLEGKCGACEYREICGGSRARSFAMTGNLFAEEPYCVYEPKPAFQQARGAQSLFSLHKNPKL